jgi:hypothetical protein
VNEFKGFFLDVKIAFLQGVAAPLMNSPVGPAMSKITAYVGMGAKAVLDMGSGALNTAAQLSVLTANIQNAGVSRSFSRARSVCSGRRSSR